jgi:amphi-Trp domain-containing protein
MSEETVHESTRAHGRKKIASYLRRVADALDDGAPVPVTEEESVTVDPPEDSELEVEVEREGTEASLELEVEWDEAEGEIETDADLSKATFELYEDNAGEWRWRLRHDNGNIIADGGEGYSKKATAENGIESVKKNAPGALVEEQE